MTDRFAFITARYVTCACGATNAFYADSDLCLECGFPLFVECEVCHFWRGLTEPCASCERIALEREQARHDAIWDRLKRAWRAFQGDDHDA